MTSYIALMRKDAASDYGVDFPDFPGCVTVGRTLEETRHMAAEALLLHLEGMAEDADTIPTPSNLDAVPTDAANHEAMVFLVDVPARAKLKTA